MATGLFLSSTLLNPSNREVGGLIVSKFNSSFYRKLIGNQSSIQKSTNQSFRNRSVAITSLFARKAKVVKRETVVPDPDYQIPIVLLGACGGLVYSDNLVAAVPIGLLGLLLLVQASRVRFVFDDEALEVKVGSELKESGENVFVGGKNRWKYHYTHQQSNTSAGNLTVRIVADTPLS